MYGEGISREGDLLDLAVNHNIVEKSGAWFSYKGERLGQGRDNVKTMLKTAPICSSGSKRTSNSSSDLSRPRRQRADRLSQVAKSGGPSMPAFFVTRGVI